MILKELRLTDALARISIFPPLTYNGEVRNLTWPQVIDISKIRDIQVVGTSALIKFWKLEKILLRTVAVARAQTFLEVRSRGSAWWPEASCTKNNYLGKTFYLGSFLSCTKRSRWLGHIYLGIIFTQSAASFGAREKTT